MKTLAIAVAATLVASTAVAETLTVTSGQSIQSVVNRAKPGDTIMISPGAYDQDLPAKVSAARSANIAVAVIGSD